MVRRLRRASSGTSKIKLLNYHTIMKEFEVMTSAEFNEQNHPSTKPKHPLFDKYVDENWRVSWPEDPQERNDLANLLVGAEIVGDIDDWAGHGQEAIETREAFAGMSDEQKQAASRLIEEILSGALYSIFLSFDRLRHGAVTMKMARIPQSEDEPQEVQEIDVLPMNGCDYNYDTLEWLQRFSKLEYNRERSNRHNNPDSR
jgi:hypothetical protein